MPQREAGQGVFYIFLQFFVIFAIRETNYFTSIPHILAYVVILRYNHVMILELKCENFYSVGRSIKISFESQRVADKRGNYYHGTDNPGFNKISLTNAIIGANSSGKTTIIQMIAFLKYIICEAFERRVNDLILVTPNVLLSSQNTKIGAKFLIENTIYQYDFVLNSKRIVDERLSVFNRSSKNSRLTKKRLFSRTAKSDGTYSFHGIKDFGVDENEVRSDVSFIAIASKHKQNILANKIFDYWDNLYHNVFVHGLRENSDSLAGSFAELDKDDDFKCLARALFRDFGLDFDDIISVDISEAYRTKRILQAVHRRANGITYNINYEDESSGSRKLVNNLLICLVALRNSEIKNGAVAVIDEIDSCLHPFLVERLVELFSDKKINKHNAQLIFSTHNHKLLDRLEKDQILLVENNDGFTESHRADSVKGLRSDSSFYSDYCAGKFGGLPIINDRTSCLND